MLLLSPEYHNYDSRDAYNLSEPVDLTMNENEDDIQLSKRVKRKNSQKNNARPTKRRKTKSESTVIYSEETSGFRIMRRIKVENRWYIYICSVFHQPGHFWTVVTYEERTWLSEKENLGGMILYGEDEFVTQLKFMETHSSPIIHAYALEKGEEVN